MSSFSGVVGSSGAAKFWLAFVLAALVGLGSSSSSSIIGLLCGLTGGAVVFLLTPAGGPAEGLGGVGPGGGGPGGGGPGGLVGVALPLPSPGGVFGGPLLCRGTSTSP